MLEVRNNLFLCKISQLNVLMDINYIKSHFYMFTSIMKYCINNTLVFTEMSQGIVLLEYFTVLYIYIEFITFLIYASVCKCFIYIYS